MVIEGSWDAVAPGTAATWFVDPPYIDKGRYYRRCDIDYETLAAWCRSLRGQVIVCENEGATWLPFAPLAVVNGQRSRSVEAIWPQAA